MGNLLRRRRPMLVMAGDTPAPIECPYITDGLIFWLDGIDRGGVSGQWIDLVGGKVFTLSSATESSNGVHFSGGASSYAVCDSAISSDWNTETLEFATSGGTVTNKCLLCPPNSGIALISQSSTSSSQATVNIVINGSSQYKWYMGGTAPKTISINSSYVVTNGTQRTRLSTKDSWGANTTGNTYLAMRQNSTKNYKGDIYSVRIYNRHLSVAEMQANQAVDAERFGLTL